MICPAVILGVGVGVGAEGCKVEILLFHSHEKLGSCVLNSLVAYDWQRCCTVSTEVYNPHLFMVGNVIKTHLCMCTAQCDMHDHIQCVHMCLP